MVIIITFQEGKSKVSWSYMMGQIGFRRDRQKRDVNYHACTHRDTHTHTYKGERTQRVKTQKTFYPLFASRESEFFSLISNIRLASVCLCIGLSARSVEEKEAPALGWLCRLRVFTRGMRDWPMSFFLIRSDSVSVKQRGRCPSKILEFFYFFFCLK